MAGNGADIPVPDPTKLTTDAVDRAKADIRREMDTLSALLQAHLDSERILRESEHRALQRVVDERWTASSEALTVALNSAREYQQLQNEAAARAAEKTEQAFTKAIDSLGTLLDRSIGALSDRFDEVKDRVIGGEGVTTGVDKSAAARQAIYALVIAAFAAAGTVLFLVVAIASHGRF